MLRDSVQVPLFPTSYHFHLNSEKRRERDGKKSSKNEVHSIIIFHLKGKIYLHSKVSIWRKKNREKKQSPIIFFFAFGKDKLGKFISKLGSFSVSKFCFNKSRNHQPLKGSHKDDPVY